MLKISKAIGIILLSVFGFMIIGPIQEAQAVTPFAQKALTVALSKRGKPYVYGATGPNSFDCSGLTQYSFKQAKKYIPRTAQSQYNNSMHIVWQRRAPGDLVFFGRDSKHITHVGIYSGYSTMVDAESGSYYGRKVIKININTWWAKHYHVYYGRVR